MMLEKQEDCSVTDKGLAEIVVCSVRIKLSLSEKTYFPNV